MINWQDGFSNGKFFWVEWHFWKVIGWLGNIVFFSRFIVQWIATEKRKRVVDLVKSLADEEETAS